MLGAIIDSVPFPINKDNNRTEWTTLSRITNAWLYFVRSVINMFYHVHLFLCFSSTYTYLLHDTTFRIVKLAVSQYTYISVVSTAKSNHILQATQTLDSQSSPKSKITYTLDSQASHSWANQATVGIAQTSHWPALLFSLTSPTMCPVVYFP